MKHGVRHPVIRGRVQRKRLAGGELLALNATLDRDPLRRERVRLGRALQRLASSNRFSARGLRGSGSIPMLNDLRSSVRSCDTSKSTLHRRGLRDPCRPPYDPGTVAA
jgi:hypothetical protein